MQSDTIPVITIDGPTASGKGTVSRALAVHLGFHYLDSGALYRLVALASLKDGIAADDTPALVQLCADVRIDFSETLTALDGENVAQAIRAEPVGTRASIIAANRALRCALVDKQRAFRMPPGLVADGRDMGTVIFPDAALKIFLTADLNTRAARRYQQLIEQGFSANMKAIKQSLKERDQRDRERAAASLKRAADSRLLDSSKLSTDAVVMQIVAWFFALFPPPMMPT